MNHDKYLPPEAASELAQLLNQLTVVPYGPDARYGKFWSVLSTPSCNSKSGEQFDLRVSIWPRPGHKDLSADGLRLSLVSPDTQAQTAEINLRGQALFQDLPAGRPQFRAEWNV